MTMYKMISVAVVIVMTIVTFACTGFAEANAENLVKTGIIGTMDEEVATLKEALTEETVQTVAGMEFHERKLDGMPSLPRLAVCAAKWRLLPSRRSAV